MNKDSWKEILEGMFNEIPEAPKSDDYFKSPELADAHAKTSAFVRRHQRKMEKKFRGDDKSKNFWNFCVKRFNKPVSEWNLEDYREAYRFAQRIVSARNVNLRDHER